MAEEKKHIIYSAADIQKYLAGNMTPSQMYELEKAALDDPLLADAIEGYEGMPEKDWAIQLESLKEKFNAPEQIPVIAINHKKSYKWWKAAAAVLLIAGTVSIAYLFRKEKQTENKQLAVTTVSTDSAKVLTPGELTDSIKSNSITADIAKIELTVSADTKNPGTYYNVEPGNAGSEKQLLASKDIERADSSFVYRPNSETAKEAKPSAGFRDDVAVAKTNNGSISAGNAAAPAEAATQAAALEIAKADTYKKEDGIDKWANAARKQEDRLTNNTQFKAQVVTPDNKPVAFANVNILNNKKNTYTDANGYFAFAAPDSVAKVEVKSLGFDTRQYTFRNGITSNKIVLQQQNNALNEVVVTKTFGKARAKSAMTQAEMDSINIAEPVDGWSNYDSYLTNNLKLPDETVKKNIHGEVEVSFDVKSNGRISNVKVDKPLCDNCDAEAVRLVKQGPQWKVKKGKKATAKVKVQF